MTGADGTLDHERFPPLVESNRRPDDSFHINGEMMDSILDIFAYHETYIAEASLSSSSLETIRSFQPNMDPFKT